jgi:hypothetical protein
MDIFVTGGIATIAAGAREYLRSQVQLLGVLPFVVQESLSRDFTRLTSIGRMPKWRRNAVVNDVG